VVIGDVVIGDVVIGDVVNGIRYSVIGILDFGF